MLVELPSWFVWIVGFFALTMAIGGVIYVARLAYVVTRTFVIVQRVEQKLVLLDTFGSTLFEIAREFKNDSGSTLLDTIQRLEREGKIQSDAASLMRIALSDIRAEQAMLALFNRRQPAVSGVSPISIINAGQGASVGQAAAGMDTQQERKTETEG